jgi:Zn-finger nucleic acid-binding protein
MRLIYPSCCGDTRLKLSQSDDGHLTHQCGNCEGHWLSWDEYFSWLEKQKERLEKREDFEPLLARDEATAGRICPECGIILARYRIGHGMSFQLDYCRRCNGVWFDRQEWDDVRAKKRSRND